MNPPTVIQSLEFDSAELMKTHPPVWKHPHKQAVYDRVVREGGGVCARLGFSRWECAALPASCVLSECKLEFAPSYYDYTESGSGVWHVNFADPRLFAAYSSALMAQDEWQVLEHPVLGSLRESLIDHGHAALTRADGKSTPVLIKNAPRQCAVEISGRQAHTKTGLWSGVADLMGIGRPARVLYGNAFRTATLDEVMNATRICVPPSLTNLIAISAPTGTGEYTAGQIVDILATAANAFRAAVLSSDAAPVSIHTGWWGCGAFGGNRQLMCMLQMLAARMAGPGRIVFHAGSRAEFTDFEVGRMLLDEFAPDGTLELKTLVSRVAAHGFRWGIGDGN